jgi:hypothetical protein
MALNPREIFILWRLLEEQGLPRAGKIIEIGAQQLTEEFLRDREGIATLAHTLGIAAPLDLRAPRERVLAGGSELLPGDAPPARLFWEWLGYDYASIDLDGSPGSIPLDLNFDQVPDEHLHRYDLVTNLGTTEHIANQLNAFKVMHDLTKVGGIMLHRLPAQGMINHGFFAYQPRFFWMLARSNAYTWAFFDFEIGEQKYAHTAPGDVNEIIRPFAPDIDARMNDYRVVDCAVAVAMRKIMHLDFVPPIDVPSGTPTDDPVFNRRYWTVFNPDELSAEYLRQQDAERREKPG